MSFACQILRRHLMQCAVTPSRADKISRVCSQRTRHIAVVLEDILDRGNENAVLRSADALGFHIVHIISNKPGSEGRQLPRKPRPRSGRTDVGCRRWLDVKHWSSSSECISHLKEAGYSLALADPAGKCSVSGVSVEERLAVVFGNEALGLSQSMHEAGDSLFHLPMCGFVNSYNVSVAAALTMYDMRQRLKNHHFVSPEEQKELFDTMVKQSKTISS